MKYAIQAKEIIWTSKKIYGTKCFPILMEAKGFEQEQGAGKLDLTRKQNGWKDWEMDRGASREVVMITMEMDVVQA